MTKDYQCTKDCERVVYCEVCFRRKKPIGRDSMDNGLCSWDCIGYRKNPQPGHLWQGEFEENKNE
jgi:hypothetical protein